MRIDLDPQTSQLIEERVRSGEYGAPAAVVAAALRLLAEHENRDDVALGRLRQLVKAGLDDFTLGRVTPGQTVFAALQQRAAIMREEA